MSRSPEPDSDHPRGRAPRDLRDRGGDERHHHALGALPAPQGGRRPLERAHGRPRPADRPGPRHPHPPRRHGLHGEGVPPARAPPGAPRRGRLVPEPSRGRWQPPARRQGDPPRVRGRPARRLRDQPRPLGRHRRRRSGLVRAVGGRGDPGRAPDRADQGVRPEGAHAGVRLHHGERPRPGGAGRRLSGHVLRRGGWGSAAGRALRAIRRGHDPRLLRALPGRLGSPDAAGDPRDSRRRLHGRGLGGRRRSRGPAGAGAGDRHRARRARRVRLHRDRPGGEGPGQRDAVCHLLRGLLQREVAGRPGRPGQRRLLSPHYGAHPAGDDPEPATRPPRSSAAITRRPSGSWTPATRRWLTPFPSASPPAGPPRRDSHLRGAPGRAVADLLRGARGRGGRGRRARRRPRRACPHVERHEHAYRGRRDRVPHRGPPPRAPAGERRRRRTSRRLRLHTGLPGPDRRDPHDHARAARRPAVGRVRRRGRRPVPRHARAGWDGAGRQG